MLLHCNIILRFKFVFVVVILIFYFSHLGNDDLNCLTSLTTCFHMRTYSRLWIHVWPTSNLPASNIFEYIFNLTVSIFLFWLDAIEEMKLKNVKNKKQKTKNPELFIERRKFCTWRTISKNSTMKNKNVNHSEMVMCSTTVVNCNWWNNMKKKNYWWYTVSKEKRLYVRYNYNIYHKNKHSFHMIYWGDEFNHMQNVRKSHKVSFLFWIFEHIKKNIVINSLVKISIFFFCSYVYLVQ